MKITPKNLWALSFGFTNTLESNIEKVDPIFQTTTFSRNLSPNENHLLSTFFESYLKTLESKNIDSLKQFNLEKTFKFRLSTFFNEFPNLTFQRLKQESFQLKIENIGKCMIFGVDLEREKNGFIHEYEMKRVGMGLYFHRKKKMEEEEIQSREEMFMGQVRQITKSWKAMIRDNFYMQKVQKFIDSKEKEFKPIEGPITKWRNLVKKSKPSEIDQDHILIEDFRITSNIGITLKQDGENNIDEDESFVHYVRTEKIHLIKEAPSLRNIADFRISDFDFWMKGNPPCSIKRFDLSRKILN